MTALIISNKEIEKWSLWHKILFRFAFIFIALQTAPWTWFYLIPGAKSLTGWYDTLNDWAVNTSNQYFFHVSKVLIPLNGGGDTSYGWAQLYLYLSLAVAGAFTWSLIDAKRSNYVYLNYWLCLFTRYNIAFVAFIYGIEKIWADQMPTPNLSQLATPLGEFNSMRLVWMFVGYSTPYQVFSGIMEVTVCMLLLFRRTATLGVLTATAVFVNVMMLNLSYDINVKIFSITMVALCLFLLLNEWSRIANFFVLHKTVQPSTVYHFHYTHKSVRIIRWILKGVFVLLIILQINDEYNYHKTFSANQQFVPFKKGLYNVSIFAINSDTLPFSPIDSVRWKDIIFDENALGSVNTTDSIFRQRYKRGYFYYAADTLHHTIRLKKHISDSIALYTFNYQLPDSNAIHLRAIKGTDSLFIALSKSSKKFQLSQQQFHWQTDVMP